MARRIGVARALSKLGLASRSVAAAWVTAGRVELNGRIVRDPETPTVPGDSLSLDGQPLSGADRHYLMFNKPRGLITTARDEHGRATVYACRDLDGYPWLAPVGRLDKASEGLLLFSNDPAWAQRILDPATHLPKIYHVQIAGPPRLEALRNGVVSAGERLRANRVELLRRGEKNHWLEIELAEGRNRHIRRMAEAAGLEVSRLVRIAIGPLSLGDLPKGSARALSRAELAALKVALEKT